MTDALPPFRRQVSLPPGPYKTLGKRLSKIVSLHRPDEKVPQGNRSAKEIYL